MSEKLENLTQVPECFLSVVPQQVFDDKFNTTITEGKKRLLDDDAVSTLNFLYTRAKKRKVIPTSSNEEALRKQIERLEKELHEEVEANDAYKSRLKTVMLIAISFRLYITKNAI